MNIRKVIGRDGSITVTCRMLVANPVTEQEYKDIHSALNKDYPEADFIEVYDKWGDPLRISYAESFLKSIKEERSNDNDK